MDIADSYGWPIARIKVAHPVENITFPGPDFETPFLVGIGGITGGNYRWCSGILRVRIRISILLGEARFAVRKLRFR